MNAVLRHYVDQLSFRPQNYLKFFVVPLGSNTLSKYLGSIDARYSMLFGDEWKELLEREGGGASEGAARVSEYLASAGTTLLLPIAEAMVTYRYDIQAVRSIFSERWNWFKWNFCVLQGETFDKDKTFNIVILAGKRLE